MFKLDSFQQQAIDYISEGRSVLVSAPTGAGKTVIAEHVIKDCLENNKRAIYTAPIKALSNQKYREFYGKDPNCVGIMTGDITLTSDAPVLIMTTEIFRNKILEEPASLDAFSWVIFDEIHYLDDYERGTVWEESLIFLPKHMNVLGLSATIPNIGEIKKWLENIHGRDVKVVKETNRPVPLHFYFQCQNRVYDNLEKLAKHGYKSPMRGYKAHRLPSHIKTRPNKIVELIQNLKDRELVPCIYFAFSRRKTQQLAEEMLPFNFLNDEERDEIMKRFDALCEKYDVARDQRLNDLIPLIERGVAYHHAGMLPTLKEVIEQLFTSRLIKVIFTTETFALGINMPARSVVFDELRKFYGKGFDVLRTRDFYQMAGRAGRRSIDTEGHVYCRLNPHQISPDEVKKVIYSQPEKVRSQFNASYATVLNLYQHYGENLYEIYPRSFHYFQKRKFLHKRAIHDLKAKVDILKELEYIENEKLTIKGMFASKVYGYELVLTEMFEAGILESITVNQLGVLILGVIYEPRKGIQKPELTQSSHDVEKASKKIVRRIHQLERTVGVKMSKKCYFHLSLVMEAWMTQAKFENVMKLTDADEGEVVRYMRMSIQLLRQMIEGPVSKNFKDKVRQLIDWIDRDEVDSEKQLRS